MHSADYSSLVQLQIQYWTKKGEGGGVFKCCSLDPLHQSKHRVVLQKSLRMSFVAAYRHILRVLTEMLIRYKVVLAPRGTTRLHSMHFVTIVKIGFGQLAYINLRQFLEQSGD